MNLLFVCLSADAADPVHATTVRWIRTLADRPEIDRLTVLALHAGTIAPHPKVTISEFRGRTRLQTIQKFYREVFRAVRRGIDALFVYQTGPYPVLLWPVKLWRGLPLYYWKAHPHISVWTWLSVRFVATKAFTPTPASLPLARPNIVITGHGIDVARFAPAPGVDRRLDVVAAGRITPSKHLDAMIRAIGRSNDRFGSRLRLDLYGPTSPKDEGYRRELERMIQDLDLSTLVTLRGAVAHADLPPILSAYRLSLNFSETALDKAVVEAMACGLPVLSTNPAVKEILPTPLQVQLIVPPGDLDAQAEAIHRLMTLSASERAVLSTALRGVAVRDHNVEVLFDRIVREMTGAAHAP